MKLTRQTIESLGKSNTKGFEMEILVVDSGSGDGSVAMLRKFQPLSPKIQYKLIELPSNLGYSGGNNVGINDALFRSDYIALLNDDTIVDNNLIRNIFLEHEKRKKVGAISPKIYFAKGFEFHKNRYKKHELGKVIWYAGGVIDWDNVYGSNKGVDEVEVGQFEKFVDTDFANGSFVMYKTKALADVGIFDERYYLYFEDVDLSMRLKNRGWRVAYSPKGKLWHKVSQGSGIGSALNDYYITRNRLLFGLKYANLRAKIALIKESAKLLLFGRKWQKIGVRDYYLRKFEKGSWGS